MASLTGQQIKDTYQSLLKTDDNGLITNAFKGVTDGSGSASGLYLKNSGVLLSGSVTISGSLLYSGSTINATVTSASYGLTASYALNGGGGGSVDTGSFATTGSNEFTGDQMINGENLGFIIDASNLKRVGFMKYGGLEGSIARVADQNFRILRTTGSNINDGTNAITDFYIAGDGKIGIGTTTPAYTLDVSGSSNFIGNQIIVGNVTFPSGSFISTTNESGSLFFSSLNGGTLQLNADGGEGDVLVGYNGWNNKLKVRGDAEISGDQIISGSINFGDGSVIQSTSASSGDGNGYTTLTLQPDVSLATDQYVVLDPTTPNHIHIRAGGVIDSSSAYLYLGGEKSNVVVRNLDNSFNEKHWVQINSQTGSTQHTWIFDNDGTLSVPGDITGAGNLATTGSNTFNGTQTISGSIEISGSIIPATDGVSTTSSFSLGSATNAWKDIWVSNGTINFLDGAGNVQAALTSNDQGLQIENYAATTGSVPVFNVSGSGNITNGLTITGSLAQGNSVIATGSYSHAEGELTQAIGEYSHAEGSSTTASGSFSHAEGASTVAIGEASHTEGLATIATGYASHAEGNSTQAIGEGSHAEGNTTQAVGDYSHAEGDNTQAVGNYSHAEGQEVISVGNYSHAEGYDARATGNYSHAEGAGTKTGTQNAYYAESVVSGIVTLSGSYGDVASYFQADSRLYLYDAPFDAAYTRAVFIISQSYFDSTNTIIELNDDGVNTTTAYVGDLNYGEGVNEWTGDQTIPGDYSHTEGELSQAIGNSSHAEGYEAQASGYASHAEGNNSKSIGFYSHAEGEGSESIGIGSHAEGAETQAIGDRSHAEGYQTIASGPYSHAEGANTTASGLYSHAEGDSTQALEEFSHAEGGSTQAIAGSSHAEGSQTRAIGYSSHAEGAGTKTVSYTHLTLPTNREV